MQPNTLYVTILTLANREQHGEFNMLSSQHLIDALNAFNEKDFGGARAHLDAFQAKSKTPPTVKIGTTTLRSTILTGVLHVALVEAGW